MTGTAFKNAAFFVLNKNARNWLIINQYISPHNILCGEIYCVENSISRKSTYKT